MAGITEQSAVPQSHLVFTLISQKKGQWQKRGHISKDVLKAVNVRIFKLWWGIHSASFFYSSLIPSFEHWWLVVFSLCIQFAYYLMFLPYKSINLAALVSPSLNPIYWQNCPGDWNLVPRLPLCGAAKEFWLNSPPAPAVDIGLNIEDQHSTIFSS